MNYSLKAFRGVSTFFWTNDKLPDKRIINKRHKMWNILHNSFTTSDGSNSFSWSLKTKKKSLKKTYEFPGNSSSLKESFMTSSWARAILDITSAVFSSGLLEFSLSNEFLSILWIFLVFKIARIAQYHVQQMKEMRYLRCSTKTKEL